MPKVLYNGMHESAESPATLRVWLVALRPFSFPASVMPVLVGAAVAWSGGSELQLWPLLGLLVSVLSLHGAANLLNDYFDFSRGLDRHVHPVSGALVRGWLNCGQVRRAALALLACGTLAAVAVILMTGWGLAVLALIGGFLALTYTRQGLCLKYMGLGDPAILVAFGILPVLAGWWVQAGRLCWVPVWWSIPLGLLSVGILHANNWRDRANDAAHGCRTLAVRLGERGSLRYWQAMLLVTLLWVPVLVLAGWKAPQVFPSPVPWETLLVLLCLPVFARLMHHDVSGGGGVVLQQLDACAARLHLLYSLLLLAGLLLSVWRG